MVWILVLLGLIAGALVNLCADGLPIRHRLERPCCAQCQHPRPLLARSGILAALTGRMRCSNCGRQMPLRYILVEVGAAGLFAFCGLRGSQTATLIYDLCYGAILILALTTDLEHRLIPHVIMLPAIALSLTGVWLDPHFDYPSRGLLGGGIGLVLALGLYGFGMLFARLMGRLRGKTITEVAFGFGDVTLITFIGFIVGVPDIFFALVLGLLSGGAGAILFVLIRGLIQRKYTLFTAIPYGPFLILGAIVMRYFGVEFMAWYVGR